MLSSLHIKNLALIREEEIEFHEGLNILTGETGAGKSVVVGSVNLALGAKADADMIRTGEESALIELCFLLDEEECRQVRALDLTPEEDGTLLIARKITQGKSVCRVNGETVTVSKLKDLAELLINIHGQNDHASLLRAAKQKALLDDYCGEALAEELKKMRALHEEYTALLSDLAETGIDAAARTREMDLLRYEIDEIEGAGLKEGEEEELERSYRRMSNAKRIGAAVGSASAVLGGASADGAGDNLADALGHARRELAQVMEGDEQLEGLVAQIDDMDDLLRGLLRALDDAAEGLTFDERDFYQTEERLNFLHRLQDKYGDSVEAILAEKEKKEERYAFLDGIEERKAAGEARKATLAEELRAQCGVLSAQRKKGAAELAEKIRQSLVDCNFLDVRFAIAVEERDDADGSGIRADGWDEVRFDIQTNPGEAMRPLAAIASGGELSRIMLGIRTVLADRGDIGTLIFDEIDAGISGRTAWRVAEKLGLLADRHQIITITHLPQIAAMADHHFAIEKGVEDERTLTRIRLLTEEESTAELARLLSADEVTDEVLTNAAQLKARAREEKAARGGADAAAGPSAGAGAKKAKAKR